MKFSRAFKIAVATALLAGTAATGAHAENNDDRLVIGGSPASNPWVVQLQFNSHGQAGSFGCTGEQLNSEWVLTAKHCTEDSYNMNVYQSNSTVNRGNPIVADGLYNAPEGDIALVHLSQDAPLASYADLDFSYAPTQGDRGTVYGYGIGAYKRPVTSLRSAAVSVIGSSTDAYMGDAVHLRGINGASNHGDSGGPLVINDKVVAVCSTGDEADPGANINAQSNYALLSQSAGWIEQTTGINYGDAPAEQPVADTNNPSDPINDWDIWDSWGSWSSGWSWSSSWGSSYDKAA